jgi:hypothetical protein
VTRLQAEGVDAVPSYLVIPEDGPVAEARLQEAVQRVYHDDVYISETSLYDVRRNQLVWSGIVQTRALRDLDKAIRRYVDTVIKALRKEQVLA